MGSFGTTEIILIVAVLFLLFGASRLPQLAKSIGQSKRAFKEGMEEADEEARLEAEKKKIASPASAQIPQINSLSDEELQAEMRRRTEAKQA
ncbi:MAG: twin-arginine translocase TatA/TatE family subunit [Pyrinomonadaceae bacterium]|nr:twin-arginine translocase TatA/TatE family subunit [Pyrinomonadaceae bacterium]